MIARLGTKLLLALSATLAMLGLAEGVVRILGIAPGLGGVQFGQHVGSSDPVLGWENAAHVNGTNSIGLRGPELREPRSGRRILCLGDSVCFGFGLEEPQTIPRRLEAALKERGVEAEVLNAGVVAYNTRQEARWLEMRGEQLAPDAIVVIYCLNDTTDLGADLPEDLFRAANKEGKVEDWARQRSLPRLSPGTQSFLEGCHIARLLYGLFSKPDALKVRGNAQLVSAGWSKDFGVVEDGFARIAAFAKARNIPVTVAIMPFLKDLAAHPNRGQHERVATIARSNGIEVVDLWEAFASSKTDLALPGDPVHPNAEGAVLAARAIAEALSTK